MATARDFKFRILVVLVKYYSCDADYPPSGRCQGNVTHFYILGPRLSLEWMKLDISNLVCRVKIKSTAITRVKVLQYGGAFSVT